MSSPLKGRLSGTYEMRWQGIKYNVGGNLADPRHLVGVRFQLIPYGATTLGAWATGSWEPLAAPTGPFCAVISVGAGQPDPVSPTVIGLYELEAQFIDNNDAGPIFDAGLINFYAP